MEQKRDSDDRRLVLAKLSNVNTNKNEHEKVAVGAVKQLARAQLHEKSRRPTPVERRTLTCGADSKDNLH